MECEWIWVCFSGLCRANVALRLAYSGVALGMLGAVITRMCGVMLCGCVRGLGGYMSLASSLCGACSEAVIGCGVFCVVLLMA